MRIDLHTHSSVSDGTETPTQLVTDARTAGLDVVAITDHDSVAGWTEAAAAGHALGVWVVPGLELSCAVGPASVHVLGYLVEPSHPGFEDELVRIRAGRTGRLPAMLEALNRHGIPITEEHVWAAAGDADSLGRPHVADALIALGAVANRKEAFDLWLAEGRPAHISRYATDALDGIAMINAAGGVAVLAHPWGRESRAEMTPAKLAEFAAHGLAGIEARHHDHSAADEAELTGLATELGVLVTGGSDWHGTGKVDHDLGSKLTDAEAFDALTAGRSPV